MLRLREDDIDAVIAKLEHAGISSRISPAAQAPTMKTDFAAGLGSSYGAKFPDFAVYDARPMEIAF